ncbi:MAG: hypothetical protein FWC20_00605 [Oscillospiraceae bacterium]|nr:hypothetical protein [Oscillospiraceae bacterium]MCL2277893.1 hypothetical protein [Oscillospiraceae bacterium]
MSEQKKKCPMRKVVYDKELADGGSVEYFANCIQDECAWWLRDACAVLQIAYSTQVNGRKEECND